MKKLDMFLLLKWNMGKTVKERNDSCDECYKKGKIEFKGRILF